MRVLRFARSDDKSGFVLLQITPKGPKALDLKLVGTEGEAPYVTSLRHDRVASLRVKNSPASEAEWQAILESLLKQDPLPDIQATATVRSESSISITVRKEIQGITQRLGAITLNFDDNEAIELFEWCGSAVEASAASKVALADLTAKSRETDAAVIQLKAQLEELIRSKDEDETALLQKFRDLLNEKKVKIREQQRVLASGSFSASPAGSSSQPSEPAPAPTAPAKPARKAGKSRPTKRKAPASKRVEEEESDDEVPEPMEVDNIKQEETDPGNTTEGTASTASDDDDMDAAPARTTVPTRAARDKTPPKKEITRPPAPRTLPFGNAKPKKPAPPKAPVDESETESDDEL